MAILIPVALFPGGQLAASATTLYATPSNTIAVIKKAVFTNTDTANRTFTVYKVLSGDTPGVTSIVIDAQTLSPGQDYSPSSLTNMVLNPGDTIQALADVASKVNAVISGFVQ